MSKKPLFFAIFFTVLLAGCSAVPLETTPPAVTTETAPITVPTVPATTVPVETAVPVETTEAPTEPEPEPVAERISEGVRIFIGEKDYTGILSDRDHLTKKHFPASAPVTVESLTPFSSLYIEWEEIPGTYTISWEGGSMEAGTYDFLHEYVRLPEAVNALGVVDSALSVDGVANDTAGVHRLTELGPDVAVDGGLQSLTEVLVLNEGVELAVAAHKVQPQVVGAQAEFVGDQILAPLGRHHHPQSCEKGF